MKKRFGDRIEVAGLVITVVEETTISTYSHQHGIGLYAACKPLGIVIESADQRWALDIGGKLVNPDELISSSSEMEGDRPFL